MRLTRSAEISCNRKLLYEQSLNWQVALLPIRWWSLGFDASHRGASCQRQRGIRFVYGNDSS